MNIFARHILALGASAALVALGACGGGSSSGGGTANSPYVGTYKGSTTVNVAARARSGTVSEPISIYVNPDGLVQIGDGESTIYASGPLHDDSVRIEDQASAMVAGDCSGVITLSGSFSPADEEGGAVFDGTWSSEDLSCFGVTGAVSGPVNASRVDEQARATRVLETASSALLRAFRQATR